MMAKPRMRDIIEELERTLRIEQEGIRERDRKIELMASKLNYMNQTERRFDQLLEGVCMSMKEASFPRRSS